VDYFSLLLSVLLAYFLFFFYFLFFLLRLKKHAFNGGKSGFWAIESAGRIEKTALPMATGIDTGRLDK